ncbi:MAG: hypothetical protein R3275_03220 [Saprospiraceae bacterium]|nr:hypothetical protein [Saprospiraceae bacterium]
MKNYLVFVLIIGLGGLLSCSKSDDGPSIRASEYGKEKSHNAGMNCMQCHESFTVSGTIYNGDFSSVYPNSTVYLLSEPDADGDTLLTIEVDAKGNFYTDQEFDFGSTVYTSIRGNDSTIYKPFPVANGACNSCHGNTADPIWTR